MNATTIFLTIENLKISPRNARKGGPGDVGELAASVRSVGLVHPLKVLLLATPEGKVTHEIIAGGRRFTAIKLNIKSKLLPKAYPVRCEITLEADADEITVAENMVRTAMHPADQFEAFKGLIDKGMSVAMVAAKFGVSDNLVTRRMKLGNVAPIIMAASREDKIDLQTVAAYGLTDDTIRQEQHFKNKPNAPAWKVKECLTEGQVLVTDKRVKLIGVEAYCNAGGALTLDLLAEDAGYVADVALLDQLVAERMQIEAGKLETEGWKWLEAATGGQSLDHNRFPERVYASTIDLSEDDAADLVRLTAAGEVLAARLEDDPDDEDLEKSYEAASAAIDLLRAKATGYSDEDKARAGALIMLTYDGKIRIERGCVLKEDTVRHKSLSAAKEIKGPALSDALALDLSLVRTAMIAATLASNQAVALASVVHALALPLFYSYGSTFKTTLDITIKDVKSGQLVEDAICEI